MSSAYTVSPQRVTQRLRPFAHLGWDLPFTLTVRPGPDSGADTVVLVHGLGCDRTEFLAATLAPEMDPYRLVLLDLPGHGATPPASTVFADVIGQHYGPLLRAVSDWCGPGPVHVVAHSMGLAAAAAAARSPLPGHAPVWGAVVSVEGNLTGDDCGMVSRSIAEMGLMEWIEVGWSTLVRRTDDGTPAGRSWHHQLRQTNPERLHAVATALVEWCDSGRVAEWWRYLPRRAVVHGATTSYTAGKDALLEGCPVLPVHGAGHFPQVDNKAEFWAQVARALAAA